MFFLVHGLRAGGLGIEGAWGLNGMGLSRVSEVLQQACQELTCQGFVASVVHGFRA